MPEETPSIQPSLEEIKTEGPSDEDFEKIIDHGRVKGDFISPMAMVMFVAAIIFDGAGFMLLFMLIDDFGILDISALIIVGGLMWLHSRGITSAMRTQAQIVARRVMSKTGLGAAAKGTRFASLLGKNEDKIKAFTKLTIKTLIWTFLIELCPYLGNIIPTWVIAVYRHLKES